VAGVTFDIQGMPEVQRMLDQVQGRELNNRMRRSLRRGAGVFRDELRAQARARADLPKTFAKTRTRAHRNPLGVSVSPQSPLSSIFEGGAGRHTISAGAGGILAGRAGDRSRPAAFIARGAVSHPGMAARPLIGPVFDASQGRASDAFTDELFEGI
jgi:hypothetical protein